MSSTREHPAVTDGASRGAGGRSWLAPAGSASSWPVLAFAAACFFLLAPWQFGRNAERTAQNNAIDASITAPAVPVTDLMSTIGPAAG